jgi:hypothetical protein
LLLLIALTDEVAAMASLSLVRALPTPTTFQHTVPLSEQPKLAKILEHGYAITESSHGAISAYPGNPVETSQGFVLWPFRSMYNEIYCTETAVEGYFLAPIRCTPQYLGRTPSTTHGVTV